VQQLVLENRVPRTMTAQLMKRVVLMTYAPHRV
jgi:hypothetical protein